MHFMVYFPGKVGANKKHFGDAGCAELCHGEEAFARVQSGPDGRGGMLAFLRQRPDQQHPGYKPSQQTWWPVKDGETVRYWIGIVNDDPPTPDDLARNNQVRGELLELEDGKLWRMPVAMQAPRVYGLGTDGEEKTEFAPRFREWIDRVYDIGIRRHMFGEGLPAEQIREEGEYRIVSFDRNERLQLVAESLAFNYRVNAPLCRALGLFTWELLCQAADILTDFKAIEARLREESRAAAEKKSPSAAPNT